MSIDSTFARRMTKAPEVSTEKQFVPVLLPWLIAAGGLAIYVVTLNHWVSWSSLPQVARASGWNWQPEGTEPLLWLVTYPFRSLPPRAIPLALNLFAALCGAMSLGLLARSVALLPHDRTEEQRLREKSVNSTLSLRSAWVPPLLAALVCGLQLTFWENATAASSEMFNLLLFAYILRCVLEFRLAEQDSWLFRAALVYGAAMANNWAMIAFLPVFLTTVIWIKGVSFFNVRFLTRMFVLALVGLSLYLLLPLVNAFSHTVQVSFWQALRFQLASQKGPLFLLVLNKGLVFSGERPLWVLTLPSLLPVLALGIRWPSYFGDPSKLGVTLTTLMFHLLYSVLLAVCVWVALDPQFSPRHYHPGLLPSGILLLPFYYLGALSVGYYSGYFLLVFGAKPSGRPRPVSWFMRWVNPLVLAAVWLLLVIAPAALLHRNLPQVRTTNGPMLKQYVSLMADGLSGAAPIVLSDDPMRLFLLQSALTQSGRAKDYVFVDTGLLPWADYHRFLKRKYPERWQSDPPKERRQFFDNELVDVAGKLAKSNSLYYLHPSFGYYFEIFYPEPHGLVYKLNRYPDGSLLAPLLGQDLISENEKFWSRAEKPALESVVTAIAPLTPQKNPPWPEVLLQKAHLKKEVNRDALGLGFIYSRALDFWGVQLQKAGRLPEAATRFNRALALNPDNSAALANLECNASLKAGRKMTVQSAAFVEDRFGKSQSWNAVMNVNGPFDEPSICAQQGAVFVQGGNYIQAVQQFARVKELVPDDLGTRIKLARLSLYCRMPDQARKELDDIQRLGTSLGVTRTNAGILLEVGTEIDLAQNDLPAAEARVRTALHDHPQDEELLVAASKAFVNYGRYSNALAIIEKQLEFRPDDPGLLFNKGIACVQITSFEQAIAPLTRVVALGTNTAGLTQLHYYALNYRAQAYLKTGKLDEAQHDYEVLQKAFPTGPVAVNTYYGLAEVALGKKDTNAAIRSLHLCLANSDTNSPDAKLVRDRLKELKPSPRR